MLNDLEKIKYMRQKLGLSQTELANIAGVSQSLITKIERGKIEPSYTLVKKIFSVLDEKLAQIHKEIIAKDICTKKIAFFGIGEFCRSSSLPRELSFHTKANSSF